MDNTKRKNMAGVMGIITGILFSTETRAEDNCEGDIAALLNQIADWEAKFYTPELENYALRDELEHQKSLSQIYLLRIIVWVFVCVMWSAANDVNRITEKFIDEWGYDN